MSRLFAFLRYVFFVGNVYKWWAAGGAALMMGGAFTFWAEYQRVSTLLLAAALLMLTSAVWGFIYVPNSGTCWPPWWVWYRNPLRKVSWRFGCVLQVSDLPARGYVVYGFVCSLRANRGRISPKRFFIESATGKTIEMTLQCGPEFQRVCDIDFIPAGPWIHCSGRVLKNQTAPDDGRTNHPTREEFFSIYDELTLVFEYDDKAFRKRFAQKDLRRIIDFTIDACSPKPLRLPVLKGGEST